ncbi:MAG: glycosyltransferase family 2 protein [bacterium]|nr:glycosyltransferase family 2 protein [bacterium]
MQISAVIIAFNEETDIADAINSVAWADEILVVDSESTDRTREIAESLGAKVLVQPWMGFSAQKQFATDAASFDWILSLDADERVSTALRDELAVLKGTAPNADGYTIPRLSIYLGREIRHGGWYPDRQLRLFDRRKGRWNSRIIHESFSLEPGAVSGKLKTDLLHLSVKNVEHHARMIADRYAPLSARQSYEDGNRTYLFMAVFAGWVAFLRAYILRLGLLDGRQGYTIAYFAMHNARMKHLIMLEMQAKDRSPATTKLDPPSSYNRYPE